MMDNLQKYKPTDKMIDLISDNYSLLQVMSRFGLSLGFGDKTVKEVCELNLSLIHIYEPTRRVVI